MIGKFFNWIFGNKQKNRGQDQIIDSVTVRVQDQPLDSIIIHTESKVKKPRKPRSPNKKKKI